MALLDNRLTQQRLLHVTRYQQTEVTVRVPGDRELLDGDCQRFVNCAARGLLRIRLLGWGQRLSVRFQSLRRGRSQMAFFGLSYFLCRS